VKKAILLYPFDEKNIDHLCTGHAVYQSLLDKQYDVMKITMSNSDGSYKDTAKDAYDAISKGFDAQFILAMDYGPWPGRGWHKSNFPNTLLVYEAGDEPQSMYSHLPKLMNSDIILTPDARNCSIYRDAFNKNCIWWPQFSMKPYGEEINVIPSPICVTSCGDDRGPVTKHMQTSLLEKFINKRVWRSHEEHASFLSSGMIIFQESKCKEITRRLMEGAALGRLVIADRPSHGTGYDELFKENEEIVWYSSKEEAVEKTKFYLSRPEECKRIGDNARMRVIKDHMVDSRVDQLLTAVNEVLQ